MIYSDAHKFVYYAPMKTGTTAVWRVLRDHYDAKTFMGKHSAPKNIFNYFSFVTVRNPYARVMSLCNYRFAYPWLYKRTITIEAVAKRLQPISDLVEGEKIDRVIHAEHLEEEFRTLPFVKKNTPFHVLNASPKILRGITKECAEIVKKRHDEDFRQYGYDKECPIPIFNTIEECYNGGLKLDSDLAIRREIWFTQNCPIV